MMEWGEPTGPADDTAPIHTKSYWDQRARDHYETYWNRFLRKQKTPTPDEFDDSVWVNGRGGDRLKKRLMILKYLDYMGRTTGATVSEIVRETHISKNVVIDHLSRLDKKLHLIDSGICTIRVRSRTPGKDRNYPKVKKFFINNNGQKYIEARAFPLLEILKDWIKKFDITDDRLLTSVRPPDGTYKKSKGNDESFRGIEYEVYIRTSPIDENGPAPLFYRMAFNVFRDYYDYRKDVMKKITKMILNPKNLDIIPEKNRNNLDDVLNQLLPDEHKEIVCLFYINGNEIKDYLRHEIETGAIPSPVDILKKSNDGPAQTPPETPPQSPTPPNTTIATITPKPDTATTGPGGC